MKKKALLFGSIPALAIATGVFLSNSNSSEGDYSPRLSSHVESEDALIDGAFEHYHMLKGDFTREDWLRAQSLANGVNKDRATFNWIDQGPDNIGGRTRGLAIDRTNINHIYAGSVSGGLFESINRANTWSKVDAFDGNLSISSICQTIDGTFYVATGHQRERTTGTSDGYDSGANGYGLYKSQTDGTWLLIDGTENHSFINEVVCDDINNVVWFATSNGLRKYDAASNTVSDVDEFDANSCESLSISKDGSVIIGFGTGGGPSAVYASQNGGTSFTEVSGTGGTDPEGLINVIGVGRCEFAISHEKIDGQYRVYGLASSGSLQGVWRSPNSGTTWERIAPGYDGTPGGFSPFGSNTQGLYDNIITVVPGAPDRIYIGGIECYTWSTTGNWEQISLSGLNPTSPLYVHADQHEMQWDQTGRFYIGNDGGVFYSDNANTLNPTFRQANRGYNVAQFFATGVSGHGDVIGGTQDNGSLANYHTGTTYKEHRETYGGDGFSADISFINRNIAFSSTYYAGVVRSSDRGENPLAFFPEDFAGAASPCATGFSALISGAVPCGQFVTNFELWENPNDTNSKDSLRFIPSESYAIGETISVPSATSQTFIPIVSPINVVYDDTLYANPGLTYQDTLVTDTEGSEYNLGIREWSFISGANEISDGDSIELVGVPGVDAYELDTIVVASYVEIDHYLATNDLKPGQTVDLENNDVIYGVSWDTIKVQDIYQSWFALDMGSSNGVWITRNALRFSAPSQDWYRVGTGIGNVSSMEFSKDGNHLFIGTWSGQLWRYSGFNDAYSPTGQSDGVTVSGTRTDSVFAANGDTIFTTLRQIESFAGRPITGIASGPIDDPEYLVVTLGNFGGTGKVQECSDAISSDSPTFTAFSSFPTSADGAASSIPCYAVVVDRDDMNIIVVGTEFGVFATEDGGSTWNNVSGDFGNSPVYDMQQNWRTWDEGSRRPGEIYAGTHGRGIWSTDAFLTLPDDNDNTSIDKFVPNIALYPNPVTDAGNVEFDLESNGDVTLQIFNLNGQVVTQVTASNLQAGKNKIAFDANDLPTGTYVLRLSSETMSETTKFIKH